MTLVDHPLGTYFSNEMFHGLFGNKNSNIESLRSYFPEINFRRIKQVHGDRIVHTSPHSIDFASEADGHYTNEKNLALCINTADCLPILMWSLKPLWIMGLHAGWRGVEKRIVPKGLQVLARMNCQISQIHFLVGPHIQKPSFEVSDDVRNLLLASTKKSEKSHLFEQIAPGKSLVDLQMILKFQVQEFDVSLDQVQFEYKDTAKDPNYHSFRRDKETAGRQISWIALK